jgi:hypothetical protein
MYNKTQMGIEGNKKQKEGTILMKEIRTEDAVGHILCHDITQIIKDVKKGVLFKKGHIVREEDIPLLLSAGFIMQDMDPGCLQLLFIFLISGCHTVLLRICPVQLIFMVSQCIINRILLSKAPQKR